MLQLRNIFQPEDSARRYDYIRLDNGELIGHESDCLTETESASWLRWFVLCSNCFCYCDEPESESVRHFSLRAVVSNVTENK